MPRISATKYTVKKKPKDRAVIEFSNDAGQVFEVEVPTVALMGLAHTIRRSSQELGVTLSKHPMAGTLRLIGPPLPDLRDASEPGSPAQAVGLSADFDQVIVTYEKPSGTEGGVDCLEVLMPIDEAEVIAKSMLEAVAAARSRPSVNKTKH